MSNTASAFVGDTSAGRTLPAGISPIRPAAVSSVHCYSIAIVPLLVLTYIAAVLEVAGHAVHVIT